MWGKNLQKMYELSMPKGTQNNGEMFVEEIFANWRQS